MHLYTVKRHGKMRLQGLGYYQIFSEKFCVKFVKEKL